MIGRRSGELFRQPITLPNSCFRFALRERIRLAENGLKAIQAEFDVSGEASSLHVNLAVTTRVFVQNEFFFIILDGSGTYDFVRYIRS